MTELNRSLSMLIYGPSKAGKTTLAVTAPYPRLYLDVESAARFLPIIPKLWDPVREEPPVADGTWDTCVVSVRAGRTDAPGGCRGRRWSCGGAGRPGGLRRGGARGW